MKSDKEAQAVKYNVETQIKRMIENKTIKAILSTENLTMIDVLDATIKQMEDDMEDVNLSYLKGCLDTLNWFLGESK